MRVHRHIRFILNPELDVILHSHEFPSLTATIPRLNWRELLIIDIEIMLIHIEIILQNWGSKLFLSVTWRLHGAILLFLRWFLCWLWLWSDNDLFLLPFLIWLFRGNFYLNRLVDELLSVLLILLFVQSKRVLDPVRESIFHTFKDVLSFDSCILSRCFIEFLRLVIFRVFKSYFVLFVLILSRIDWFLTIFSNFDFAWVFR